MAKSKKYRTDQQIVNQTNELALIFYKEHGYEVCAGYRFDEATHPQEKSMWNMAVAAQEFLTQTDAENALAELDDNQFA